MSRVSGSPATRRRRKRYLKQARGYVGGRRKLYKTARESVERGLQYAYRDRRRKKRDFRRLWISRINAAARRHDMTYSQLIHALNTSGVELNRKVLADLAVRDEEAFAKVVETAKAGGK
jgi:large subunit ribosomal protein L20